MEKNPGDDAEEKYPRRKFSKGGVHDDRRLSIAGWRSSSNKQFALQWYGKGHLFILLSLSVLVESFAFRALCSAVANIYLVDGGHRAIKYTRIGGVGKEIYQEGKIRP